jgi:hypothetical protein
MFYQKFQPSAMPTYHPILLNETHKLLHRLLIDPFHLFEHLRLFVNASLLLMLSLTSPQKYCQSRNEYNVWT